MNDINIQHLLNSALAHHSAGRLAEADERYREILQHAPDHPDALHLLGVIAHQTGQPKAAVALMRRALKIKPKYAEAHYNLANALKDLEELETANTHYQYAVAIKPDYADAYNNQSIVLLSLQRYEDAIAASKKALAIRPDFAPPYANMGNALRKMGRLEEAVSAYEKAISLNPTFIQAHTNLAHTLGELRKKEEAVLAYRNVLTLAPNHVEARLALGQLLLELGRFDESTATYDAALANDPSCVAAHAGRSQVTKFVEYDDEVKAMEALYCKGGLAEHDTVNLAFGLGKAFEDLGEYEKAFDYYTQGNAIRRQKAPYSADETEKVFSAIKAEFDTSFFKRHENAGYLDDSPIFIVGMPRSGTSLVEQILASHPEVHGAGELGILHTLVCAIQDGTTHAPFPQSFRMLADEEIRNLGAAYVQQVRKLNTSHRHITDKAPGNFAYLGVIKAILPNAKVIHCSRSPMATCFSIFKNNFGTDIKYSYSLEDLGHFFNLYSDIMGHWKKVIPDFFYTIEYEKIVENQKSETRSLLNFCGLAWNDSCLSFHKTNRPVQTVSASQVRQPLYHSSVQKWKRFEEQLRPLQRALRRP